MRTIITWAAVRVQKLPADDELVLEVERNRKRSMHVANLRRLNLHQRREYMIAVERREGADARREVEVAFLADWEARRPR